MAHPSQLAPLALLLSAAAAAQSGPQLEGTLPIRGPVRHAGTYHVATGTWTPSGGPVAAFGQPDNIYSNTAQSGYYTEVIGPTGSAALGRLVDEGRVPSSGDPAPYSQAALLRDRSSVTEVQIAYCDFDTGVRVSGWTLDFYEQYAPCTDTTGLTPTGTVVVTGAPSAGCWILDIDLSGGGEFDLDHDGDGVHDAAVQLDSFGVRWSYTGTGTASAGPIIAGDPATTDLGWVPGTPPSAGTNTYYEPLGGCPNVGTGLFNQDFFRLEDPSQPFLTGCRFLGGYVSSGGNCTSVPTSPYSAFWLEVSGAPIQPPSPISTPGCVGAVNSTGGPGSLDAFGSAQVALNDVELRASSLPPQQFVLFMTGTAPLAPGVISVGNGFLCIDTAGPQGLGRLNVIKNSGAQGVATLSTVAGEWNLAALPGPSATYSAVAGLTSHFQAWHRDVTGAGSNLTGSGTVTWQ